MSAIVVGSDVRAGETDNVCLVLICVNLIYLSLDILTFQKVGHNGVP